MSRRLRWGLGAVLGTAAGLALIVVLLNLTLFIEATVPSRHDLPDLPQGLRIANESTGCGSGSCFRTFDVVGEPGDSPSSIRSRLPEDEHCSANSLVDRRPRCVGFRLDPDGVSGYVTIGKWSG